MTGNNIWAHCSSLALISNKEGGGLDRNNLGSFSMSTKPCGIMGMTEDSNVNLDLVFPALTKMILLLTSGSLSMYAKIFSKRMVKLDHSLALHVSKRHLDLLMKYDSEKTRVLSEPDSGEDATFSTTRRPRASSIIKQDSFQECMNSIQLAFDNYADNTSRCGRFWIGDSATPTPHNRHEVVSLVHSVCRVHISTCATVLVKFETDCSHPEDLSLAHC